MLKKIFLLLMIILFVPLIKAQVIGQIQVPEERIVIESQTYIDQYINYTFIQIDDVSWFVKIKMNPELISDSKILASKDLCNKYLSTSKDISCDVSKDSSKVVNDLNNMTKYPLKPLTDGISFKDYQYDEQKGEGSFVIYFPNGFKNGEKAKLGFGSTDISSTFNYYPISAERQFICNTPNKKHVIFVYNSTNVAYLNTTLIPSTWSINLNFYRNTYSTFTPLSMYCDGSTITIMTIPLSSGNITLINSQDEGLTWTTRNILTSSFITYIYSYGGNIAVSNNISYIFFNNVTIPSKLMFLEYNWTSNAIIVAPNIVYNISGANFLGNIVLDGSNIYIAVADSTTNYYAWGFNSSNGVSWTKNGISIDNTFYNLNSIMLNGSKKFIIMETYDSTGTYGGYTLYNTTNMQSYTLDDSLNNYTSGSSASTGLNSNSLPMIVILNNSKSNLLLFNSSYKNYKKLKLVNDLNNNIMFTTFKNKFDNNMAEMLSYDYSHSRIYYDFISFDGRPNILGIPYMNVTSINLSKGATLINCTANYNGANNGWTEFVWYINNTLISNNGSAMSLTDLSEVSTNNSLNAGLYSNNTNVSCSARAYNGTSYSAWVNSTTIKMTGTIPSSSSCSYSGSGSWIITCSDACSLTTNTNLLNNVLVFNGSGTIINYANLTNISTTYINNGCVVKLYNNSYLRMNS